MSIKLAISLQIDSLKSIVKKQEDSVISGLISIAWLYLNTSSSGRRNSPLRSLSSVTNLTSWNASSSLPKNHQWLKILIQFNLKTFTFPLVSSQIKKTQGPMCYSPRNLVTPLSSSSSLLPSRISWRTSNDQWRIQRRRSRALTKKRFSMTNCFLFYLCQFIKNYLSFRCLFWENCIKQGGWEKDKKFKENERELFSF